MGIEIAGLGLKEPVAVTTAHGLYDLGSYSSAGTGNSVEIQASEYTWQVITTGEYHIALEGSIDGANWFALDEVEGENSIMRHIVNKTIRYVRVNVITTTANLEVKIWV